MSYTIITHAGKAHMDEILAAAILAVHKGELPVKIHRLPSEEVAAMLRSGQVTEGTWVIDCGLKLNPAERMFDHHQSHDLPSAALLMFMHCFPDLGDTALNDYFRQVSQVDTRGLRSLGDPDEHRDYWLFPQQMLTSAFQSDPLSVVAIVSEGLTTRIRLEHQKIAAAAWLSVPGRLVPVRIGGVTVLEYREPPPEEVSGGLKAIDENITKENDASIIYGFDSKDSDVRVLFRTDIGHDRVDFSRVTDADTLFNHQGGFLMRFRPRDVEEWKRIVRASIIP